MKTNRKLIRSQKNILERKLQPWLKLRSERVPPSGWLRAIRGALGMSSRQLADRMGLTHVSVIGLEAREKKKRITLELLEKAADAMDCRLIYAVVPKDDYRSIDDILWKRSREVAREIVQTAEHSMRLESQSRDQELLEDRIREIAEEMKNRIDRKIWDQVKSKMRRKKGEE